MSPDSKKKAAGSTKAKPAKKEAPAKKPTAAAPAGKQATSLSGGSRSGGTKKNAPVQASPKSVNYFYAAGRRKTSVAMVRLHANGKGNITINNRTFENYFPLFVDQDKVLSPLNLTSLAKAFDISVHVHGGGVHSQAEAIRHGVARALLEYDPSLRTTIKPAGHLTRDSRVKERKKYGLHRARRAPQFSKR